jgi:hypothetical protein
MVLKYISKTGSRIYGPPYTKAEEDEFYRRIGLGPITVARLADDRKRLNETAMDLEQTIDALVYRKKKLDLDSPERRFINRILTGLRYSYEDAGGIIEDLDFDWGATVRLADDAQSPRPADSRVLPFP